MQLLKNVTDNLHRTKRLLFLCADRSTKIKLILRSFLSLFKGRLPYLTSSPVKLQLCWKGTKFFIYIRDDADLVAIDDVFLKEIYRNDIKASKPIILDFGSHIGISVIYFKLKFTQSRIICFEPNPGNYQLLLLNIKQLTNAQAYNWAITDRSGNNKFYLNQDNNLSSSLLKREAGQRSIWVRGKTITDILKNLKLKTVDIIKFDIEGEEYRAFLTIKDMKVARNYIGEYHPDLTGKSLEIFRDIFKNFHFNAIALRGGRSLISASC